MTTNKTPQPGEWWVDSHWNKRPNAEFGKGDMMFIAGRDVKERTIYQDCSGFIAIVYDDNSFWDGYHHEPACTGWDWKPEVFPQWYQRIDETGETGDFFVNKRVDATKTVRVYPDGREVVWDYPWEECPYVNQYVQITEAEAMEMLEANGPEPAVVEDWVELTDPNHVLRPTDEGNATGNVDVGQDVTNSVGWVKAKNLRRDGQTVGRNTWARWRCRRRDLPVIVPVVTHEPASNGEFVETRRENVLVEPAKRELVRTVTLYFVFYTDTPEDLESFSHSVVFGTDDLNDIRGNWKFVQVYDSRVVTLEE